SVHSCSCSDDTSPPHTSSLPLHDALPISEESKRAALVADELQVPILTLTRAGKITDFGPNVFRNMLTDAAQADALAQYATKVLRSEEHTSELQSLTKYRMPSSA